MTCKIHNAKSNLKNKKTKTSPKKSYSVYLAGDLWSHKDLIGNALLADYIKKVSRGRYYCIVPQDLEEPIHRTEDIRNLDLKGVMLADLAIFNFDGPDLDSGTVVEFIYAKMLDIPSVIFRTDFRSSGEGKDADQDPWNLMASYWPRTKKVLLHGMAEYQDARAPRSLSRTIDKLYRKMAKELIKALDEVMAEKPLAKPTQVAELFDWALEFPGSGYRESFEEAELQRIIAAKTAKGLLNN